jgi:hypothetical protein
MGGKDQFAVTVRGTGGAPSAKPILGEKRFDPLTAPILAPKD